MDWRLVLDPLQLMLPTVVIATFLSLLLAGANWFLLKRHPALRKERRFARQLVLLSLGTASLFVLLFSLPLEHDDRDQLIGLFGLLVSGAVAFASSSALSNIAAGVVLRVTAPFGIGDHVAIGEHVGRVVDAGVLDVEIQSRDRELVSLPNSFVAATPITRTRESGAIVSTSLSLGYDNHHEVIAPLLREAASQSGLEDPFVGIVALGDFAVTYRVAGLLRDVDKLIGAHTGLACAVLDILHENDIEIMSPTFVRKQSWPHEERIIPAAIRASKPAEEDQRADEVVFDKASRADQLALETSRLKAEQAELEQRLDESRDEERLRVEERINYVKTRLAAIEQENSDLESEDGGAG